VSPEQIYPVAAVTCLLGARWTLQIIYLVNELLRARPAQTAGRGAQAWPEGAG